MGRRFERANKRNFTRKILVLYQLTIAIVFGGTSGRDTGLRTQAERGRYDVVASRVLQGTDAPNCDNEAPRESYVSVRTAARYVNPVEEAFGDVSGYMIVVGYKGDKGRFQASHEEEKASKRSAHFWP
jgi:hypothetical protein